MKVLLTGATGFVGEHVRDALLADGQQVVCAVRRKMDSGNPRLSYITADLAKDTDNSAWLARLAGIDVVINTVGIFRESRGQSFSALHTETPCALVAACATCRKSPHGTELNCLQNTGATSRRGSCLGSRHFLPSSPCFI